jgi:hypothetical protein
MVLRDPVAVIAERFATPGERKRFLDGDVLARAFGGRRLVEDG